MKTYVWMTALCATLIVVWAASPTNADFDQPLRIHKFEYVTIRWAGRENTHLIRSNGKVEMLKPLILSVPRPDRVDERSFYMNIAMNAAAKEGFEFAGMTHDEIVMKREIK